MACHPRPPALWCRCLCALLLSSALLLGVLRGSSGAQITLDGSLGPQGPLAGRTVAVIHTATVLPGVHVKNFGSAVLVAALLELVLPETTQEVER
jgi:hypothetical protein